MSEAAERLKPALAALTRDERAELVEFLIALDAETGDGLTPEEWEAAWEEEINRRVADHEAGRTQSIPHEEVMRRFKEKYG